MTGIEYLSTINELEKIDAGMAEAIQKKYGHELPEIIKRIISFSKETVFLENDTRILSASEIIQAEEELHVKFSALQLIPLVDCGDNNFIVYHFSDGSWSKFNLNDESIFKQHKSLEELLK